MGVYTYRTESVQVSYKKSMGDSISVNDSTMK